MWNGKRLAVILPTYNEHLSIAACIRGFESLGIVDEILVVNNNAHPDTSAEVAPTTAREVLETTQGYGAAIRRGFLETRSFDLVCVCEPDGTFDPADLLKLLPYTHDVDVVFGSRTTQALILSGANMGWFLKWGNWAVAKLVEVLFNTSHLSNPTAGAAAGSTGHTGHSQGHRSAQRRLTGPLSHLLGCCWLGTDA